MFRYLFILLFFHIFSFSQSFDETESKIKSLYNFSLTQGKSYDWLEYLSNQIGSRLSGSLGAERAVEWAKQELENLKLDKVWIEPVMVSKWVRGNFEYASIESSTGNSINVSVCALGGSIATPSNGIRAQVIELRSFDELKKLGKKEVQGKIVFFNSPMDPTEINTFLAYEKLVDLRRNGAKEAAKYGAIAVVIRSLNLVNDDFPHTGSMSYGKIKLNQRIPALSISTNGANLLSSMIKLDPSLKFFVKQNCKNYPDVLSYNVIGEIEGYEYPKKIILIATNLDSWDLGDGSHDNGSGVVQSMEVLNNFKSLNLRPRHTIRVVLFMNNENSLRGSKEYLKNSIKKNEHHLFALESDSGGFSPRGFSFDSSPQIFKKVEDWNQFFKPFLANNFYISDSGVDIKIFKYSGCVLSSLKTDSQKYFDYHHSAQDIFSNVNKRELELGSAAMSSLVYLVDTFGL